LRSGKVAGLFCWICGQPFIYLLTSLFIYQGRQKDATAGQQKLGHDLTLSLREVISPYFLRRTKQDVGMDDSDGTSSSRSGGGAQYVQSL